MITLLFQSYLVFILLFLVWRRYFFKGHKVSIYWMSFSLSFPKPHLYLSSLEVSVFMCLLFSRHWDDISRDSCNRLLPGKNLWTVNKTLVRPGCWIPALVSVSRQRTNVPDQLQRRTQRRMDSCKPIVDVSS